MCRRTDARHLSPIGDSDASDGNESMRAPRKQNHFAKRQVQKYGCKKMELVSAGVYGLLVDPFRRLTSHCLPDRSLPADCRW
jgi:hypothetical protein